MTFDEYQEAALKTAVYPKPELPIMPGRMVRKVGFIYPALGLCGEAGEVAEKCKKIIRDKNGAYDKDDLAMITKELGDVCWYLAALCHEFGLKLDDVAKANVEKLRKRMEENKIHGSGDNR